MYVLPSLCVARRHSRSVEARVSFKRLILCSVDAYLVGLIDKCSVHSVLRKLGMLDLMVPSDGFAVSIDAFSCAAIWEALANAGNQMNWGDMVYFTAGSFVSGEQSVAAPPSMAY